MSDLCFGIIGSGMAAEFHVKAIRAAGGMRAKGVFSTSAKAGDFARHNDLARYESLDAMLADPDITAVTIATPSGFHGDPAVAAARAGRHVLCEKPLEITPAKAMRIVDACAENGVILAPVFQLRYGAGARLIRKALDAGRFGKLLLSSAKIRWFRPQSYYDSAGWRGTWELDGGGCLMNQAIHAIDLMTWFGGVPADVFGRWATRTHDIPVEDVAVGLVRFGDGVMGVIEASTSCAPGLPLEVCVSGERGTATLCADALTVWSFVDEDPLDAEAAARPDPGGSGSDGGSDPRGIGLDGYIALLRDMAKAVNGEANTLVSGQAAIYPIEIICGIYASARTNRPVALPHFSV
jgi:predicted dehydrogenase